MNGSRKQPIITIEGWKLNHTQDGMGSRVSNEFPPGRTTPTSNAHALLHISHLHAFPPPRPSTVSTWRRDSWANGQHATRYLNGQARVW